MLDFKFNYYFEKYKDKPIVAITKFKIEFIKENGNFELLNELVIRIQKYQLHKYKELVNTGRRTAVQVNKGYYNSLYTTRMRARYGTKEERMIRKVRYDLNEKNNYR